MPVALEGAKTGRLEFELVGSNRQAGKGILTMVVGDGLGLDSLRRIGGDHRGPDDHPLRLVLHRAGDAAVDRSPQCRRMAGEQSQIS